MGNEVCPAVVDDPTILETINPEVVIKETDNGWFHLEKALLKKQIDFDLEEEKQMIQFIKKGDIYTEKNAQKELNLFLKSKDKIKVSKMITVYDDLVLIVEYIKNNPVSSRRMRK